MNFGVGNKRGNTILDIIFILIVLFVFVLGSVFGLRIFNDLNTDIQSDPTINSTEALAASGNLHTIYPSLFDNLILFAMALLIIFTLVAVFMMDTHPVFFFIMVILLIAVFVIAIILANAYDDIMQDTDMSSVANSFPYTTWIMTHLLQVMIAAGFIVTIAMFIKFRAG